jgi:hypothetical protein
MHLGLELKKISSSQGLGVFSMSEHTSARHFGGSAHHTSLGLVHFTGAGKKVSLETLIWTSKIAWWD